MCKLADIHHRLTRALIHDKEQISQWLAYEQERVLTCENNVIKRTQQYNFLENGPLNENLAESKYVREIEDENKHENTLEIGFGNESKNGNENETKDDNVLVVSSSTTMTRYQGQGKIEGRGILECMSKLQREVTVRSQLLLEAEEQEDQARKVRKMLLMFTKYFENIFIIYIYNIFKTTLIGTIYAILYSFISLF